MKFKEIKDDAAKLAVFKDAANNMVANFNLRSSDAEKTLRAYQLKEDEEKSADLLGHSLLSRARALCALQDGSLMSVPFINRS